MMEGAVRLKALLFHGLLLALPAKTFSLGPVTGNPSSAQLLQPFPDPSAHRFPQTPEGQLQGRLSLELHYGVLCSEPPLPFPHFILCCLGSPPYPLPPSLLSRLPSGLTPSMPRGTQSPWQYWRRALIFFSPFFH